MNLHDAKEVKAFKFTCPSCGGGMEFSPEDQKLKCQYCGTLKDIEFSDFIANEYDIDSAQELLDHNWGSEKLVMKCSGCGGSTIVDTISQAKFCSFCGSSNIIKTDESAGIKPEALIPFQITKNKAEDRFRLWMHRKYLAPNDLRSKQSIEKLQGVYIPFFTYDAMCSVDYVGEKGRYYNDVVSVFENGQRVQRTERKIDWTPVRGHYDKFYDDILQNASKNIDDTIISRIGFFDTRNLKPYLPEFMLGFIAEKYSITLKEGWDKAINIMDGEINSGIRATVSADELRIHKKDVSYSDVKFKHVLLPLWISTYNYKGRMYRFLINGDTGTVSGEYPKSPMKMAIMYSLIFLFIVVFYMLLQLGN